MIATHASVFSIWATIVISNNDKNSYEFINYSLIEIGPIAVSLSSIQISTMRILAIFLWRQAISSLLWPNKSILIMCKPYIIWKKEKDDKTDKDDQSNGYDKDYRNVASDIVKALHRQRSETKGTNNQSKTVRILGEKQQHLNEKELFELYELIKEYKSNKKKELYYYCQASDSFLGLLCGENIRIKLNKVFRSEPLKIIFCLSMLVYIICRFSARFFDDATAEQLFQIFVSIQVFIVACIAIPYAIFFILSFNKYAFKKIATGFEFWLKFIYAIQYVAATAINELVINPKENHPNLTMTWQILVGIWYIVGVIIVSSLDALKIDRKWKIAILTPACIMVVLWTLFLMFGSISNESERDNSILIITSDFAISLLMLQISGIRVVAIFFCKQLFSTIYNKGNKKNKATSIVEIPRINWKKKEATKPNNNSLQINNSNNSVHNHLKKAITLNESKHEIQLNQIENKRVNRQSMSISSKYDI
eukprot:319401_1